MARLRSRSLTLVALMLVVAALVVFVQGSAPQAKALPAAGTDILRAKGQVVVESRLGSETIDVAGSATIQRSDPYLDGDVEVVDLLVTDIDLAGESLAGEVVIAEDGANPSTGELRSVLPAPDDFPAKSSFDIFVIITAPSSPSSMMQLKTPSALRLTSMGSANEWPPVSLKYTTAPLQGVDNDGDTLVDEDTPDEDGDHLFDEDRPGADPFGTCGWNADCDGLEGEDPPVDLCAENNGGTGTPCDADADTLVDEDPECFPLSPTYPAGVCIVSLSVTLERDTDGDGCTDAAELGPSEVLGGRRDPLYFWDFYDVWTPYGEGGWERDKAVALDDILAVADRFGEGPALSKGDALAQALVPPTDSSSYHPAYDRGPPIGPNSWDLGPPDGVITLDNILETAEQFGHDCS